MPASVATTTLDMPIAQLHQALSHGEITPVDIAQHTIEQVERYEPHVHAWVVFDKERLLKKARELSVANLLEQDKGYGLLQGIPIAVKDNMNTEDFTTEMGSPLWKGFTPGNDARVVFHALRNGALVAGKSVTAEFAVHALGKTLNPHNPLHNPGTSSSGSAAAIATNMVQVALGTQTAGSIVRPASYCGVYGIKPSFGLIPRTGILKTTDTLDTIGFFIRHFADYDRVLQSLRVDGPNYPVSYRALRKFNAQLPKSSWRVAVVQPEAVWKYADPEATQAFDDWIQELRQVKGMTVTAVKLPELINQAHDIHETIYNKTLSYYFQKEYEAKEDVSEVMASLIQAGQSITPEQYVEAIKQQDQCIEAITSWFEQYDVVLTLSTAGPAPLRDAPEPRDSALIWNLLHLPVISAPAFISRAGLPFGLQVVGPKYSDHQLGQFVDACIQAKLLPSQNSPLSKTHG